MLRFSISAASIVLVLIAACGNGTSTPAGDSCDNACESPTDSAIASCESTVQTGFWGFTRYACGAGGSTECPKAIQGEGECAGIAIEFDADDGGTFPVTSTKAGVFHVALPAGDYRACCTAQYATTLTCQSISLAEGQSRHVDEATYETGGGSWCSFTAL